MRTIVVNKILPAALLSLAAVTSASAVAGQVDETRLENSSLPSRTVTFLRSELSTAEGRAGLERRIRRAARLVCGSDNHHIAGTLHAVARNEACYERAVNEAMAQIGAEQLASVD